MRPPEKNTCTQYPVLSWIMTNGWKSIITEAEIVHFLVLPEGEGLFPAVFPSTSELLNMVVGTKLFL